MLLTTTTTTTHIRVRITMNMSISNWSALQPATYQTNLTFLTNTLIRLYTYVCVHMFVVMCNLQQRLLVYHSATHQLFYLLFYTVLDSLRGCWKLSAQISCAHLAYKQYMYLHMYVHIYILTCLCWVNVYIIYVCLLHETLRCSKHKKCKCRLRYDDDSIEFAGR